MTHRNRQLARAKINLTLHVTGRRPDGLHLLDSLVVFAEVGDVIEVTPAAELSLTIDGPFAHGLSVAPDNLVLRAATYVGAVGAIRLTKVLPVSSGIGGGSADAAATVRAMVDTLPDARSLQVLGADVPVCLASRTTRMRGIGEVLDTVPDLPPCWVVLVNPGVAVSTPAVFKALETADNPPMDLPDSFADFDGLTAWLGQQRNDLQEPACQVAPVIRDVLTALDHDAALARMSGSGATCFGLYPTEAAAQRAADRLRAGHPDWWVAAAPLRRD